MDKGIWKKQAFEQQMSAARDFPHDTPVRFTYAICCGHRTGSNLLGEALYRTGQAGDPMEYFNQRFLLGLAPSRGGSAGFDLDRYMEEMKVRRTSPNGVFGINVKLDQLTIPLKNNLQAIPAFIRQFDAVTFLFRRDKIRQAISVYIGQCRDLFNVPAGVSDDEVLKLVETVPFDPQKISICLNHCIQIEQSWLGLFKQHGISFEPLAYEDFTADFESTIGDLLGKLGVAEADREIPSPPMKKVGNQINDGFRSRFVDYIQGAVESMGSS